MDINNLRNYKISESTVLNSTDKKHIENYKQLVKFFENSIDTSINNEGVDYKSLHASCIQCIRFLDNLVNSYDTALQSARLVNKTIDTIIKENNEDSELGNEKEEI